jgi:hypothetical protein
MTTVERRTRADAVGRWPGGRTDHAGAVRGRHRLGAWVARAGGPTHRALLALAAIACLAACDAFTPRDPEDPGEDQQPLILLTQPESVLVSLEIGLESQFINTYINAFDETFAFHPDPEDSTSLASQGINAFADPWDRQVEEQATSSILGTTAALQLTFGTASDSGSTINDNTVEFRQPYELTADASVFVGFADLTLVRGSGSEWRITNWQDVRASGERSWSVLRGENR